MKLSYCICVFILLDEMAIKIPDSDSSSEPDKPEESSSLTAPSDRMCHDEQLTSVGRK